MSLSGYRRLWRAATLTFKTDTYALLQARIELRTQFEAERNAPSETIPELLEAVDDAEEFLLNNITQARAVDENTFRVELEDPHLTGKGASAIGQNRNLDFNVDHSNVPDEIPKFGINVSSSGGKEDKK